MKRRIALLEIVCAWTACVGIASTAKAEKASASRPISRPRLGIANDLVSITFDRKPAHWQASEPRYGRRVSEGSYERRQSVPLLRE